MTTIAHISDLHFGITDPAAVERIAQEVAQSKADLLVVSGDLTQRARAGQYEQAKQFLARLPSPQLVVPGNHDIPLFAFWRRIFSPFGRFRHFVSDNLWPTWHNDEVFVVGMNTACRVAPRLTGWWKDGKITPDEDAQIRREFAAAVDGQVRVLVAHHPFIEPPGGHAHGIVHGAAAALRVIEECKVDLILSGHLHMAYYYDLRQRHKHVNRPMINLVAGSATSTRRREKFNSWNVVRIDKGKVQIEVRFLQ
jgi:3',5'-cyclic AMP phosphodiesterase CpdA